MSTAFYFENTTSPAQFNLQKQLKKLGYDIASHKDDATFSDQHLQLNEAYTEILEFKHRLTWLVNKYCPHHMPVSYIINDENYPEILADISDKYHDENLIWILKPSLLNNGEGIQIFQSLDEIATHFQSHQRFDGPHILQHYISSPHLLGNHKYSLRMFVIITNFNGAFLYPHGYLNISKQNYQASDFDRLDIHLTNEHLSSANNSNVIQMPTTRIGHFNAVFPDIKKSISQIISALSNEVPLLTDSNPNPAFGIFGFDYLFDKELNLWLLEVNHGPCFPKQEPHILKKYLYNEFWLNITENFVIPMMQHEHHKINYQQIFNDISPTNLIHDKI